MRRWFHLGKPQRLGPKLKVGLELGFGLEALPLVEKEQREMRLHLDYFWMNRVEVSFLMPLLGLDDDEDCHPRLTLPSLDVQDATGTSM